MSKSDPAWKMQKGETAKEYIERTNELVPPIFENNTQIDNDPREEEEKK